MNIQITKYSTHTMVKITALNGSVFCANFSRNKILRYIDAFFILPKLAKFAWIPMIVWGDCKIDSVIIEDDIKL